MRVNRTGMVSFVLIHDDQNGMVRMPPATPTAFGTYETKETDKIDSKGIPIKVRKAKP